MATSIGLQGLCLPKTLRLSLLASAAPMHQCMLVRHVQLCIVACPVACGHLNRMVFSQKKSFINEIRTLDLQFLTPHCVYLLRADNVYGVLPPSGVRTASIILMLIHQIVAYALCALLSDTNSPN